jgi:hypothetical protein
LTAGTRAFLLPWFVWVALCGFLATGCGAADPLPASEGVVVDSAPAPALTPAPEEEKSEVGGDVGGDVGGEGQGERKGARSRLGQRQESTPLTVLRSSTQPAAKPIPLPTRQNEPITLEFLFPDGEPFKAPLSASPPPHFLKDVVWHAVYSASQAQEETDDASGDSVSASLTAFFSWHVLVLGPGKGALKKASEWMSKFVSDGESVSFLASKNASDNATRKSIESLKEEAQKRALVETLPPVANDDSLEKELLGSFEHLFAWWQTPAFSDPVSSNLYLRVEHKKGSTQIDPVFEAFFGSAPEFLPSGRLVPFQLAQRTEATLGAFLRDGVLYVTIRNETSECAAFDIHLPATLEAKHVTFQSLSTTASSKTRVVAYAPSTNCIPPGDLLLVRASSAP